MKSQDGTHYAVTVDAVVGDMVTSGCQNRPVSQVTLFRPAFQTAIDLPHWMSQLPGRNSSVGSATLKTANFAASGCTKSRVSSSDAG